MHTITVDPSRPYPNRISDMNTGQFALALIVKKPTFILKTYSCFVNLENPCETWNTFARPDEIPCEIFKPGTILSITIKD